jgi:trehalose synthase
VEECAEALRAILDDPPTARQMALRGKEYVRRSFLSPRLLRDWLALFNRLDGNDLGSADLVTASTAA